MERYLFIEWNVCLSASTLIVGLYFNMVLLPPLSAFSSAPSISSLIKLTFFNFEQILSKVTPLTKINFFIFLFLFTDALTVPLLKKSLTFFTFSIITFS